MDIEKKLSSIEFRNRENNISHIPYERENAFFHNVRDGNIDEVRRLFKPLDSNELGQLSADPLRNMKYHFIITVSLLTRYSIEGGMETETAYNLSDVYIRSADIALSEQEIKNLHHQAVEDFTQRMSMVKRASAFSKTLRICFDYIYDNLHTKITLEKLAAHVELSPAYLSKLFHKEVGMTVSEYVMKKRIEAAENMLRFSNHTCLDISNYLCFSSESHFIQSFKKITGCTPKQFREKNFRKHNEQSV